MQRKHHRTSVNEQIQDEATEWFIRFCEDEVDGSACEEFDAWLRVSPQHVRAYLDISAFWVAAGSMTRTPKVDVDLLVQRARAAGNVVALDRTIKPEAPVKGERSVHRLRLAVAASLLFTCLALGTWKWWQVVRYPSYATQFGEQRTFTLEDGSVVELNARTRIRVRFTDAGRDVDLIEGQALFRVAKNPDRPFIVASGNTRVRAVGTEFDVYQKARGTVVTVVEGRVSVSAPPARPATPAADAGAQTDPVLLSAGEQVTVTSHRVAAPSRANVAQAMAWTEGKLVFDSTPLSEVVQEFNRYNARPLSIDDPQVLALHISGAFRTTDSAQLIRLLSERFGLVAHDTGEGTRLSHE
jgi:transmembrane sensor